MEVAVEVVIVEMTAMGKVAAVDQAGQAHRVMLAEVAMPAP